MDITYPTARTIPVVTGGSFLLGHTSHFQKDPLGFLTGISQDYGAIARYRLANMNLIQVNSPDGIQRMLHDNNKNYVKGDFYNIIRVVAGEGLIASEGEHWLRQRRMMNPHFHRQRIAGFADIMTRRTNEMLDHWEKDGLLNRPFNLAQEMTNLTMGIITEAMFSSNFEDRDHSVSNAITYLLEDVNYRYTVPFYPGIQIPTIRNLRTRQALRILDGAIYRIINERNQKGGGGEDLLGMLMASVDEETGEGMSAKHLRDEAVTVFAAGHETTAVTLSWLFYLLDQNKNATEKMYAEVDELGGKTPGVADLPQLAYTRQCIDETIRLYPPAWIINRMAIKDDEISGYPIPAGSTVTFSPYVTHHLPEFWPDPERFDPDRFAPDKASGRPRFAYLPFGGGPHRCIGNDFALLESTLVTATIAQRYHLELVPGTKVIPQTTVTLRPKHGLQVIACPL